MLKIPEITDLQVNLGSANHMPPWEYVPSGFKNNKNPYCKAVSSWFFEGGTGNSKAFATANGAKFKPKEDVDGEKAMRAIRAVLGSFDPKHEHKIAACAYMLSEWFDGEFPND